MDIDAPTIDIDAASTMDIDAPTLSIDGPAGNITSNRRTLHTHTHQQTGGTADDGDGPDNKQTSAPKDPS